MASSSARRPRSQPRHDVDRPGLEVGRGLAVGGRRPRQHPLARCARSPARSRCAGSACAPAVDTAFALGDTVQLATTITDGHGGVAARRERRVDQHRYLGGLGGQRGHRRRAVARRRRRSWRRPAGTSRSRGSWSARARRPSSSTATPLVRLPEGGVGPPRRAAWSTPGGIRCPGQALAWRSARSRRWPPWTAWPG